MAEDEFDSEAEERRRSRELGMRIELALQNEMRSLSSSEAAEVIRWPSALFSYAETAADREAAARSEEAWLVRTPTFRPSTPEFD
ncbi:hypothetical protein IFU08_12355 [Microbacterium sp. CFBP 8790]|uniref:hypothetical protein n=1 Tax=unclassified Microbacterium TaxID=2609290 RepID=UPI00178140A2|nr:MULTISPECIES: hypothetical protein [unclassified Microbacterium]MBD8207781.1 hypothetical protein [Microbacterium sp. CFBP 8801]MBD8510349.1 hypothetical protein [Microbacterium sp. CFBP 8790]